MARGGRGQEARYILQQAVTGSKRDCPRPEQLCPQTERARTCCGIEMPHVLRNHATKPGEGMLEPERVGLPRPWKEFTISTRSRIET